MPSAWRNWLVFQPDRFELYLEDSIKRYRGSAPLFDMLCYHFGYGQYGPARSGKRLRPRLVLVVAEAGGATTDEALDAAVAVELLHNYSLIHDDIEDRDELRRGRSTLWAVYGIPQALNAGDALCAMSFLALTHASGKHRKEPVLDMVRALHEAHVTMCDGQSLDLAFERASEVGLRAYYEMIAAKTAALFGASSQLGALCAGCSEAESIEYRQLGRAFGMAFQIRDDVLGVWGSSTATGKVRGNDIARRKWTFPVVWALGQPPSAARDRIARAYAAGEALDSQSVEQVVDALDVLEAQKAAHRAVAEHLALVERHSAGEIRDFLLGSLELASR